ncbi:MAG TPA: bifunctional riboflavin kinase/FAD synthetase [Solirubrobacteraceae bacterium]|nr:bifunctional riboflavin kinase/FAD synthetase [Solirubrobacteraceae bacterium]
MEVTPLAEVRPRPRRVAVGEFDGVHLGHRRVIAGADTVLTFEPHPAVVVHPERAPKLITSLAVKAELIAGLGVDELVVIPFDQGFAHQSPQEFIGHVLVETLGATHVAVGDNFRFGHNARGTTALLEQDGRFAVRVERLVEADGETISSTRIRGLVAAGEMEEAGRLLGAPFRVRGPVVGGDRRGRDLGFPTANLVADPALVLPAHGVYACRATIPDPDPGAPDKATRTFMAATNVGVRPTFGGAGAPNVEAFLLDFSGDLYGQTITVEFLHRLRGEQRYEGIEPLVAQMQRDVGETRRRLS